VLGLLHGGDDGVWDFGVLRAMRLSMTVEVVAGGLADGAETMTSGPSPAEAS